MPPISAGNRENHRSGLAHGLRIAWGISVNLLVIAGVVWLGHRWWSAETDTPKMSFVEQSLDYCSPFQSLGGGLTLNFTVPDHSVIVAAAEGKEKAKGIWVAEESTQRVFVEINNSKSEYTLLLPDPGDQCILASGSLKSADLTSSWFATPGVPRYDEERPCCDP
jgi:hypothetical protein